MGNSSTLNKHIITLFAERSFECTTCDKKFAREIYLKSHQRIHGSRNYLCLMCPKTFFDEGALKNHLNIHAGVRKFACPTCNKTFAQSTTRNEGAGGPYIRTEDAQFSRAFSLPSTPLLVFITPIRQCSKIAISGFHYPYLFSDSVRFQ